jgi:phosphomannomutase
MKPSIFRLYDIRGRYPSQINEKEVFDIAANLGAVFGENKKIIVGYDARKSSLPLHLSVSNGLKLAGFKVVDAGLITYPMIYFLVSRLKAGGGIMVTASHNPKEYNGLKIINSFGTTLGGLEIFKKIKSRKPPIFRGGKFFEISKPDNDFQKKYAQYLSKFFDAQKKIKVVIDGSDGTAGPVVEKLHFPKNIKPIFINIVPNGNFFSHGPDPIKRGATKKATAMISKHKADLGVIFDGDGDRAVFLDDQGRQVRPEKIWRLLAIKYDFPRTICTVVDGFFMAILKKNAPPSFKVAVKETKVGHLFVRKEAKNWNADVGIESSAHYYFKDDNFSGSGILAMIKVLNVLSILPYQLSDIVKMLPKTERVPEINRRFFRKKLPALYSKVKKVFRSKGRIYSLDGVSVYAKDWWFNLRPSNTENLVRINIEGLERKKVLFLKKELLKLID